MAGKRWADEDLKQGRQLGGGYVLQAEGGDNHVPHLVLIFSSRSKRLQLAIECGDGVRGAVALGDVWLRCADALRGAGGCADLEKEKALSEHRQGRLEKQQRRRHSNAMLGKRRCSALLESRA